MGLIICDLTGVSISVSQMQSFLVLFICCAHSPSICIFSAPVLLYLLFQANSVTWFRGFNLYLSWRPPGRCWCYRHCLRPFSFFFFLLFFSQFRKGWHMLISQLIYCSFTFYFHSEKRGFTAQKCEKLVHDKLHLIVAFFECFSKYFFQF